MLRPFNQSFVQFLYRKKYFKLVAGFSKRIQKVFTLGWTGHYFVGNFEQRWGRKRKILVQKKVYNLWEHKGNVESCPLDLKNGDLMMQVALYLQIYHVQILALLLIVGNVARSAIQVDLGLELEFFGVLRPGSNIDQMFSYFIDFVLALYLSSEVTTNQV